MIEMVNVDVTQFLQACYHRTEGLLVVRVLTVLLFHLFDGTS